MQFRSVFGRETRSERDAVDAVRREFREQLYWVGISRRKVNNWVKGCVGRHVQTQSEAG